MSTCLEELCNNTHTYHPIITPACVDYRVSVWRRKVCASFFSSTLPKIYISSSGDPAPTPRYIRYHRPIICGIVKLGSIARRGTFFKGPDIYFRGREDVKGNQGKVTPQKCGHPKYDKHSGRVVIFCKLVHQNPLPPPPHCQKSLRSPSNSGQQ